MNNHGDHNLKATESRKSFKRIDRFVEGAIYNFAEWITSSDWQGKERDCVNIFATRFILPDIDVYSAISEYSQVRIECGVPQPKSDAFKRPSAAKDLVIWPEPLDVAWDSEWNPVKNPLVIMEWKTRWKGNFTSMFDDHDTEWLTAFTKQNVNSFGYAVTVDFRDSLREVHLARFRKGNCIINQKLLRKSEQNAGENASRPTA